MPKTIDSNLVIQVTDLLRADIIGGALAPGTRLTEAQLSGMYGVSRVPVREALRILEGLGFVVVKGTRVRQVASMSRDDIDDLMAVRSAIEIAAAAKAAVNATPEQIRLLRTIITTAKRRLASEETDTLVHLNTDLHRTIIEASHSSFLTNMFSQISDKITWIYAMSSNESAPSIPWRMEEHSKIVQAITKRDPEAARAAMSEHMECMRADSHSA